MKLKWSAHFTETQTKAVKSTYRAPDNYLPGPDVKIKTFSCSTHLNSKLKKIWRPNMAQIIPGTLKSSYIVYTVKIETFLRNFTCSL